jgi:predicted TIM-barrel fold metal-dependent hydrolase
MVVDSHVHAWGAPSPAHPWTNGPLVADRIDAFSVETVYTAEALLADMDRVGVEEAVVVGYPVVDWTDNWYTEQVAAAHDRLHGVVMLDPFAEGAAERLRDAMATDGVLGVRLGAICPRDRMWETFDPSVTWLRDALSETAFWTAAAETGAAVQVLAHHEQLDQVQDLVERHPDLTYLLDHFAHAGPETDPDEAYADLRPLADNDGVAVKVSEVVHRSDRRHPYTDMHDHVRWLVDVFGPERVVWGSDFPNVSDEATYAESLSWLDAVDALSTADRRWLTDRALRRHVLE